MDSLPIALQCYIPPKPKEKREEKKTSRGFKSPDYLLILDTETATENTRTMPGFDGPEWSGMNQSLLFGRMIVAVKIDDVFAQEDHVTYFRLGKTLYKAEVEYVFYPDHLPERGLQLIKNCLGAKPMGDHFQPEKSPFTKLYLLPRLMFMNVFYDLACRKNSYVIGFNLPFDLSRLAIKVNPAKSKFFYDGFSFTLWEGPYRPHLRFVHIGNKRDFSGWGMSLGQFQNGKPTYIHYKSSFVDLHTLIFALTSESYSLASAAAKYHAGIQKKHVETHGVITSDYLAYNRQDVLVTLNLAFSVLNDYLRHPILKRPENIFSAASIAKGYLEVMNIKPRLEMQPKFSAKIQGAAMSAYFGGRVDTMIRKIKVPVVHTDFLSMYPTVNSLMKLWDLIIAQTVQPIQATKKVRTLLKNITLEDCFDPLNWPKFRGMALVLPDRDLLPVRAKYGQSYQIGQNYYRSDNPQWFMIPDLVASKIRTGKTPKVLKAYLFEPHGIQKGLKAAKLQNKVEINPIEDDFFRKVIEERYQVKKGKGEYSDLTKEDRDSLQLFLKNLANAGGYGINAERNEIHVTKPEEITVYSNVPFQTIRDQWEVPGKYFFAPLASLITSAARLMLSLLECEVIARGGTFVTTDTDSMMIVADETRHDIKITGSGSNGRPIPQTITALSRDKVKEIARRFERLNPYDPAKVLGSILKIEDDNFDSQGKPRKLYCYAIGPKRYCLFLNGDKDRLTLADIVEAKESGLKFFLDPQSDESGMENNSFVKRAWLCILNNDPVTNLPEDRKPVVYQFSVTTAYLLKRFKKLNAGKPYCCQIKPFNFILQASTEYDFTNKSVQTLIASYDPDPEHWSDLDWVDYQEPDDNETIAIGRAKKFRTIGSYLRAYKDHPEYAYNGPDRLPCSAKTSGLLSRRTITRSTFVYQGKGMMSDDEIQSNMPTMEDGNLFYGKADYKHLIPLVMKIMPDIPRDFLAELIPNKSYKTFYSWQTGKRALQNVEELINATAFWTRCYVTNSKDLSMQELFKAYLAYKKELSQRVQRMARKIPDSVLHHKMNLSSGTIARLRRCEDLQLATLRRVDELINKGNLP